MNDLEERLRKETEQIDTFRKTNTNLTKVKQQLKAENVDLANEVKNLNQNISDTDRKQLESNLQDLAHKYQDSERLRLEIAEKLSN